MHEGSKKAIFAAFVANLGIAIAKFIAFALTGAASMLAEAIHSVADTGNQSLLFLGGRRAQRAESKLHPFGYGRERSFWGFVVALVLFSLGAVFATYEGVEKLIHPHKLDDPAIAFAVLGIAICLELFSFRTAIREANRVSGGRGWWEFIRTSNRGAGLASGRYLLFLNNDVTVTPEWLSTLLATMERYPECGAVQGKLIRPDGTLQEAGSPPTPIWRSPRR